MISYIFFLGDADEAVPDTINPLLLRREFRLEAALITAAQISEKEGETVRIYEDNGEDIAERFIISAPQAAGALGTSGAVLLEVLKDRYERTHRLLEQEGLEDFSMLKALHDADYWQEERDDIQATLERVLPYAAKAILRYWKREFDDEYKEARGDE